MRNRVVGNIRTVKAKIGLCGRALTRAFADHYKNHWILQNVLMESKGPEETLRLRSTMCFLIFCTCSKAVFTLRGPNDLCYSVSMFVLFNMRPPGRLVVKAHICLDRKYLNHTSSKTSFLKCQF